MNSITLNKVSKSFGSKTLFEDVEISFNEGERYGLTGPNGSGKSTLLKIIMNSELPSSGTVSLPDRIGILRQNIEDFADLKVLDVVIMGNGRLWQAFQKRETLYEKEMTDEIGMQLGELEGIIAEEDGYSAESNAEILLDGVGISHEYFEEKLGTIPIDLQFRALLCQALFGDPQALLLDEPTNHLDLDSIRWLENFMQQYKGVLIVVSHDRHFLNAITTKIADIDYETIILYPGNYDDMVEAKTSVRERSESDAKSKQKKIDQLKEFVARFSAGTRASQVKSRIREINRLEPQELKKSNIEAPYIVFTPNEKQPGKIVLKAHHLFKSYDEIDVISNFSYEIHRGDKIGVIGCNGLGKTTLIKMLAGVLQPDKGSLELGHQVQISYFPQNHTEVIDKGNKITAFDWLKEKNPSAYDQEIRGVLGKMLFSGDDAFKSVSTLSGGETARLILAQMMLIPQNVLILDEPNNHLDLEAVSALGRGMNRYKETVIVVSHDRDLIDNVATKIIAFKEDGVCFFDGPLEDYLLAQKP